MERTERARGSRLLQNQPYDESLEVADPEEVASVRSPTPRGHTQSWRSRRGRGLVSTNSGSDEFDDDHNPLRSSEPRGEEEEEEEEEEESDEEDSDDDDSASKAPEGAYDPADYANLPVSTEIKELFQYITRYSPQCGELEHSLKPFIPDFIPAVGDIDAFLKVPRPDGKPDELGVVSLDEPSVKQSDPTVMSLWLSEDTKQHGAPEVKKVSSVSSPQVDCRAVDHWVQSVSALHRCKPAAGVHFVFPLPEMDALMEEWPCEMEELLQRLQPPAARMHCSAAQYADAVCALLDIPVYTHHTHTHRNTHTQTHTHSEVVGSSRIHSLYLLFSLYLEFRDSQHFTRRV